MLACECGESFPIIRGVPRFLVGSLQAQLQSEYPEFFQEHRPHFQQASLQPNQVSVQSAGAHETRRSFGFEWSTFTTMRPEWEANFWGYFAGKSPDFFKDKLVLDAGCGMGRHLYYACKAGAETIGVDFSRAVDVAYQNTRNLPNAHVVQADITRLPFRPETFDLVYSLGVIHHLPDPDLALTGLIKYLRPGGDLQIFVYWGGADAPAWKRVMLSATTAFRRVTTRLPHALLLALCYPISLGAWFTFVLPYQLFSRLPFTRALAEKLPLKQYARYSFGVLLNDQFDRFSAPLEHRYSREQVRAWLARNGLESVSVDSYYGWLGHGVKACAALPASLT